MASDLADLDAEIRDLIEAVRGETEASLRLAVRYSGDDTGLLYRRFEANATGSSERRSLSG